MNSLQSMKNRIAAIWVRRVVLGMFALSVFVTLTAIQTGYFVATTRAAGPYVVGSTGDTPDANPGDGTCADASSNCTLRAALDEVQASGITETITINGCHF